jgi:hypothetical protein
MPFPFLADTLEDIVKGFRGSCLWSPGDTAIGPQSQVLYLSFSPSRMIGHGDIKEDDMTFFTAGFPLLFNASPPSNSLTGYC